MTININIDSLFSFVGSIITMTFTIYYFIGYLATRKDSLYLVLSVFMGSLFIYLAGYSLYSSARNPHTVLFWTRICYAGGALIMYGSYLMSSEIIGRKSERLRLSILALSSVLIALIFLPVDWLFTGTLNPVKSHSSVIKGPLFPYLLIIIYIVIAYLMARFIRGLLRNRESIHLITPILFGLVFWFMEALVDGILGAMLSIVNMKISIGPIIMTFSLALYRGRKDNQTKMELILMKDQNREFYNALIYDKLSALYSRQYFLEALEQRSALISREEWSSDCLMFIDVDNFKRVNDELGHNRGDELIIYVGEILRKYSRKSDICARYGGDEFLILLENCRPEDAAKIAETITERFNEGLPALLDSPMDSRTVSFSIGIVCSRFWSSDPLDIIKKADMAMYSAKRKGKNSIVHYSEIHERKPGIRF